MTAMCLLCALLFANTAAQCPQTNVYVRSKRPVPFVRRYINRNPLSTHFSMTYWCNLLSLRITLHLADCGIVVVPDEYTCVCGIT